MGGETWNDAGEARRRSEQLRLDEIRRRGDEAGRRRGDGQAALDRARNERLHAERHRADEARRRRAPLRGMRFG